LEGLIFVYRKERREQPGVRDVNAFDDWRKQYSYPDTYDVRIQYHHYLEAKENPVGANTKTVKAHAEMIEGATDARRIEELMLELKTRYTIAIVTHNLQQAQRVADMTGFLYVDTTQGGRTAIWWSLANPGKSSRNPK